jgi:hypothetical protein
MEARQKAIKLHLKRLNLPASLIDEATFIALNCSKNLTKLTKICAAIGLINACSSRGIPETVGSICEKLGIKYRNLSKHFSRMKVVPTSAPCRKIAKLEEMLEKVDADEEIRDKAYALMSEKTGFTALKAVGEALSGCHGLSLLAQQVNHLLPAKRNKNDLEKHAEVRILKILEGQDLQEETILDLSMLDVQGTVMDKELAISYLR